MPRPVTAYELIERGIRRVTKTYDDGRVTVAHQIKYADVNGKIVSKTLHGSLSAARATLASARAEVQKGDHVVITKRDSRTTFKQVAVHWHDNTTHMKSSTRTLHRRLIDGRLAPLHDVPMRGLTYERLQQFQTSLTTDGLAPSTQKQIMWVVKAVCSDAVKRGLLRSNPVLELAKIKARRSRVSIPTGKEVEALIDRLSLPTPTRTDSKGRHLKEEPADPRWSLLVETAAYSGLRAGELAGLQVRDFNLTKRSLKVVRSLNTNSRYLDTPKSEAGQRTVDDLDPGLCARLATMAQGKRPTDFLFGWTDAEGVSSPHHHMNFYRRHFKPACDEAGLDIRFHDLRHFFASILIADGEDLIRLAALLGHSSAAFTLTTYGHLVERGSSDRGARIAARRASARGEERKVVPMRPTKKKPF